MVPLFLRALREWKILSLNSMDGRIGDHLVGLGPSLELTR